MNHYLSWTDKPITWGGRFKLIGICTVIGASIIAVSSVVLMDPSWWRATKDFVRRLFRK